MSEARSADVLSIKQYNQNFLPPLCSAQKRSNVAALVALCGLAALLTWQRLIHLL